jgi:hypothetical protein
MLSQRSLRLAESLCEKAHLSDEALYDSRAQMREDRIGRFIEGADRTHATLLPEAIDDYVGEGNPVRVVDAFVDCT